MSRLSTIIDSVGQRNCQSVLMRLEHFLHPYRIKYLTILLTNLLKTPAFDKSVLFVEFYASCIEG